MPRHPRRVVLLVILVLASVGAGVGAEPAHDASPASVFDQVWRTVAEHFYDRTLNGVNWNAMRTRYQPLVASAASAEERAQIINRMLESLGASHTVYLTGNDPAYYDLLDIFSGGLRREVRRLFPDDEVSYTGIGVFTRQVDGKTFVSGVLEGLPAHRAGLHTGDEIVAVRGPARSGLLSDPSVAGRPYAPVESFTGTRGVPVTLTIRRTADGPREDVVVVPDRIQPTHAFLTAMEGSARVIESGGARIGYIHVWCYAGSEYQALLERELYSGALKDADALVWDLRDGWGGAQMRYLDTFSGPGPVLEMIDRSGKRSVDHVKWSKPVAMLVNGGTRSGKELLAYGFKKYGLGELVGTRTTGAVLAARAFMMDDGSLLELAVNDVRIDGERLEGVGVTPTVEVPFSLPYAEGRDPQLQRAIALLSDRAGKSRSLTQGFTASQPLPR
jgi:C-terminal processing protease CtpA/Prc